MVSEHSPKFRRRRDARPEELIEAALRAFGARGFVATSLDDIAKEAGVTKGTIYLYFENKEALFREAVLRYIAEPDALARAALEGQVTSVAEQIQASLLRMAAQMDSPAGLLMRLFVSEARNFPDLAAFYFEHVIQKGHNHFRRLIELGVSTGEFRQVNPDLAVVSLIAVVPMHAMAQSTFGTNSAAQRGVKVPEATCPLAHQLGTPPELNALIESHIDIILNGLLIHPPVEKKAS